MLQYVSHDRTIVSRFSSYNVNNTRTPWQQKLGIVINLTWKPLSVVCRENGVRLDSRIKSHEWFLMYTRWAFYESVYYIREYAKIRIQKLRDEIENKAEMEREATMRMERKVKDQFDEVLKREDIPRLLIERNVPASVCCHPTYPDMEKYFPDFSKRQHTKIREEIMKKYAELQE